MRGEPNAAIRCRSVRRDEGVGASRQQGGGHGGRQPVVSVLQHTCRTHGPRKWRARSAPPMRRRRGRVGERGPCAEAGRRRGVERGPVQILEGVAETCGRSTRAGEEQGSAGQQLAAGDTDLRRRKGAGERVPGTTHRAATRTACRRGGAAAGDTVPRARAGRGTRRTSKRRAGRCARAGLRGRGREATRRVCGAVPRTAAGLRGEEPMAAAQRA